MKWLPPSLLALLFWLLAPLPLLLAQGPGNSQGDQDAAAQAAGAVGCFACGTTVIIIIVVLIAINIAILVWVARDAKNRGMDNAVLWMLLVFFTHLIGLIVYICSRPQGTLVVCQHCHNKRLAVSARCPHCGNA